MSWLLLLGVTLALGLSFLVAAARRAELGRMGETMRERDRAVAAGDERERLRHPVIDLTRCLGCATCVSACPEDGVLEPVHGQALVVRGARCQGIAACARECPVGAITVTLADLHLREDVPVVEESCEAADVPGLFLAGEVTAHGRRSRRRGSRRANARPRHRGRGPRRPGLRARGQAPRPALRADRGRDRDRRHDREVSAAQAGRHAADRAAAGRPAEEGRVDEGRARRAVGTRRARARTPDLARPAARGTRARRAGRLRRARAALSRRRGRARRRACTPRLPGPRAPRHAEPPRRARRRPAEGRDEPARRRVVHRLAGPGRRRRRQRGRGRPRARRAAQEPRDALVPPRVAVPHHRREPGPARARAGGGAHPRAAREPGARDRRARGRRTNPNNHSNITGERIVFRQADADFTYQNPFLFQLGVGPRGKIDPIATNTDAFFYYLDQQGDKSKVFAFSDRNGKGASTGVTPHPSLSHNSMMPHSIRGKVDADDEGPRYCNACHLTEDALSTYGTQYDTFRAALSSGTYGALDFNLLKQHIGRNPNNQMDSPIFVHMVAGLGSGLFFFDAQGRPVNPLDDNPNRTGFDGTSSPKDIFNLGTVRYDLDRIVTESGAETSSSNHALLDTSGPSPLRDGATNPTMAGPLGAALIERLANPLTGIVLNAWLDANGAAHGGAP